MSIEDPSSRSKWIKKLRILSTLLFLLVLVMLAYFSDIDNLSKLLISFNLAAFFYLILLLIHYGALRVRAVLFVIPAILLGFYCGFKYL